MADLATLRSQLEALKSARRSGVTRTRFGDREVQYKTDNEMRDAIAALETEIAAAEGSAPVRSINIRNKGWS